MDRFVQRSARKRDDGRPAKKPRLEEVRDSDDENDESSRSEYSGVDETLSISKHQADIAGQDVANSGLDEDVPVAAQHETAFESSLPAFPTDGAAIEEYEAMKVSQAEQNKTEDPASRMENRKWVRGKSSIYVDAFNLALDTVLEDEAHLFDDKEKRVFDEWRNLSYESQYLLVLVTPPICAN